MARGHGVETGLGSRDPSAITRKLKSGRRGPHCGQFCKATAGSPPPPSRGAKRPQRPHLLAAVVLKQNLPDRMIKRGNERDGPKIRS